MEKDVLAPCCSEEEHEVESSFSAVLGKSGGKGSNFSVCAIIDPD